MSEVQLLVKCQQCGGPADRLFNCRTCEDWIGCRYCGYTYSEDRVVDEEKTKAEGETRYKTDEDGRVVYRETETKGYGLMSIATEMGRSFKYFDRPVCQTDIDHFRKMMAKPETDESASFLSIWDDEKGEVRALIGELPKEWMEYLDDEDSPP